MTTPQHPCDTFLTDAATAFDSIAHGLPPHCSATILDALVANGLIRRTVRIIGRDSLGPILRHGYSIPSELYAQWQAFTLT